MEDLIKQSLAGNQDAYITLIKNIQIDLFRVAKAKLSNIDDINDAIQETIIISFENLKKLKHIEYFKTWIIKILINQCNQIYRKSNKQLNIFNKLLNTNDYAHLEDTSIHSKEDELDFDILIDKLNYNEKIVITLYYNNQFSTKEITNILDTNVNTVKSRLTRAKKKLKIYYEEGDYDDKTNR